MVRSTLIQIFISYLSMMVLCRQVECRRNKTGPRELEQVNEDDKESGGILEDNVLPYLVTLWLPKQASRGPDGRLIGYGIYIAGKKMIFHDESYVRLRESRPDTIWTGAPDLSEPEFVVPTPKRIDIVDGIQGIGRRPGDLRQIKGNLGCSSFGLYHLTNEGLSYKEKPQLVIKAPVLERNASEFGSDCRIYKWSLRTKSGIKSTTNNSTYVLDTKRRDFVSFPIRVIRETCNNGLCEMESARGSVCNGFADRGSPILCGPEKKLTYIITASHSDECEADGIPAFHIPYMIKDLERYARKSVS